MLFLTADLKRSSERLNVSASNGAVKKLKNSRVQAGLLNGAVKKLKNNWVQTSLLLISTAWQTARPSWPGLTGKSVYVSRKSLGIVKRLWPDSPLSKDQFEQRPTETRQDWLTPNFEVLVVCGQNCRVESVGNCVMVTLGSMAGQLCGDTWPPMVSGTVKWHLNYFVNNAFPLSIL